MGTIEGAWEIEDSVKAELDKVIGQLTDICKKHHLPAFVLVQTRDNEESYGTKGFTLIPKDRSTSDEFFLPMLYYNLLSELSGKHEDLDKWMTESAEELIALFNKYKHELWSKAEFAINPEG